MRATYKALVHGQANILRRPLDSKADVNTPVNAGRTAFALAINDRVSTSSLDVLPASMSRILPMSGRADRATC